MASVLIIGGTGVISTEVCAQAVREGWQVTLMNRNRRKAFVHPQAKVLSVDVKASDVSSLRSLLEGQRFNAVIDFLSYDTRQLERMLRMAKGHCGQFVFISTATVYHEQPGTRYTEDCPIDNGQWDYCVKKAACERFLAENAKAFGVDYTVIRPYITYGKTRLPFQVAPLQYYTIIQRMRCGKPIPAYGKDVRCTLTLARDFAVGAVGLLGKREVYGEAYHITGQCEETWEHALSVIAGKFGLSYQAVSLPKRLLQNKALTRGLDVGEILGDKGRDMLFDNSKIRKAVPEFTGSALLEDAIDESVAYFQSHRAPVNYAWEGRIDRLMSRVPGITRSQKRKLRLSAYGASCGGKDRIVYLCHRYEILYVFLTGLKRSKRILRR